MRSMRENLEFISKTLFELHDELKKFKEKNQLEYAEVNKGRKIDFFVEVEGRRAKFNLLASSENKKLDNQEQELLTDSIPVLRGDIEIFKNQKISDEAKKKCEKILNALSEVESQAEIKNGRGMKP